MQRISCSTETQPDRNSMVSVLGFVSSEMGVEVNQIDDIPVGYSA